MSAAEMRDQVRHQIAGSGSVWWPKVEARPSCPNAMLQAFVTRLKRELCPEGGNPWEPQSEPWCTWLHVARFGSKREANHSESASSVFDGSRLKDLEMGQWRKGSLFSFIRRVLFVPRFGGQ